MSQLLKVSLRQKAVFIEAQQLKNEVVGLQSTTSLLLANLAKLGYAVSEPLLRSLNQTSADFQDNLLKQFREIMGVDKNWTPLVKGWDLPTGEKLLDHIMTYFANVFGTSGTTLQCGHIIPDETFPLERYTGCPFCGTPFHFGEIENYGQGSKKKVLELWTEKERDAFYADLLGSKTALDATQMDSLKILLLELPMPATKVGMKETLMAVIDMLVEGNQANKAAALFKSPTDVLRYLWYKHTGFFQIIKPKTISRRTAANKKHLNSALDQSDEAEELAKKGLKLKYSRRDCLRVAGWLNGLSLDAEKACEMMHPHRGIWVRFIRALRLVEYGRRKGFEQLNLLLDTFHAQEYSVWQGELDAYRKAKDIDKVLGMLKQRPGIFARSLFATMLHFQWATTFSRGWKKTIAAFSEVIDKVPARLIFTLNMYAENYFNPDHIRSIKPLGGVTKQVPANPLLKSYTQNQLKAMKAAIEDLCVLAMKKRFSAIENTNKTIFVHPALFKIPVSIGDRSDNVQDLPSALMGTRFSVEGDTIRLFMQWGEGLPAQHLDMDLSCYLAYKKGKLEYCSYSNLTATGCKHSGDIRSIPHMIGTAEYIDINISKLQKAKVRYATFICNAYSNGSITPNLVVGWMDSKFPMKISQETGVAYDPSCVQHQVRITNGLSKGLVFGVLDVDANEVIWLEMSYQGQVAQSLNIEGVKALLAKLDSKLNIGQLLKIKAEAQKLNFVETAEEADEVYDQIWAQNTAAVTKLLVD